MSATGRSAVRVAQDVYETPAYAIHRLLEAVQLPGGQWLEPSAGNGAIIRAVNEKRSDVKWVANEIRPECLAELLTLSDTAIGDFLSPTLNLDAAGKFAVAILNPPFAHAQEFIEKCKGFASWVCALERLNFLEGDVRNSWLREDAPDIYVLPNRPSFTGKGTDATAYAWYVYGPVRGRSSGKLVVLPSTPIAERRTKSCNLLESVGALLPKDIS